MINANLSIDFKDVKYQDTRNNRVFGADVGNKVRFRGSDNLLIIPPDINIDAINIDFWSDGGHLEIEHHSHYKGTILIGNNSYIRIGSGLTVTANCYITAGEGVTIEIGNNCMFAKNIEIRADDSHPIYSKRGERLNPSASIFIGDSVWLAEHVAVFGGSKIGAGSIIGFRSLVNSEIPNNCLAVGSPARVVKKDLRWDRSHLLQMRCD